MDFGEEEKKDETLMSLAQEEKSDMIPEKNQKLIQKHQNKFKDF